MSFYGADLNTAFGTSFEPPPPPQPQPQPSHSQNQVSTPIVKLQTIAPLPSQQVQLPPPPQKIVAPIPQKNVQRRETIKIITYALIILFALALYSVFEMIIKEICTGYDLGYKQEIAIRLLYPLLVFVILWNVRMFIQ